MKRYFFIDIISLLFTMLFLYTAISKWMDYNIFKEQIALSPLLAPISKLIAISLPITETVIAVLLLIPKFRLIGLYISTILMTLFTIYILYILASGQPIPCTCGGLIEALSWNGHLVFNCAFILIGVTGIIGESAFRKKAKVELKSIAIG
ncbi:hypothetical protein A4D02_09325 [Niastella koreensis]|uniref:Methylamine utilisation protein MauE domain-containing protein n=2 Tax=Niastella koreensis TaxID=354356 RepID=G8TLX6_NIAKG|nr:MauE/DoxX family redox-associated membrane protein [Niastella koreensis]AEV98736.1 hypothetical protein Niako_2392 [Niastella koreensis GR20-10]OQP44974.1 hypothetical protein A4D02_09325 [Niastella koreensis]